MLAHRPDVNAVLPTLTPAQLTSGTCAQKYRYLLSSQWVPLALKTPCKGFLRGLFLASCRHLAAQRQEFAQRAAYYKLQCIQAVNDAISAGESALDEATVATVMSLAFDEVSHQLPGEPTRRPKLHNRLTTPTKGCSGRSHHCSEARHGSHSDVGTWRRGAD